MQELSDEELAAIAAGPGFLPEFYRRHVAKVTGVATTPPVRPLGAGGAGPVCWWSRSWRRW